MKLKTENIYQVIDLPVAPAQVFEALLNQDEYSVFTGKDALIQPHEGGAVSICNGQQTGWITRLVRNKRIVVALMNKRFPAGHCSVVDIRLLREENEHTTLEINHLGVPADCAGGSTESWKKVQWATLASHLRTKAESEILDKA